MSMFDFRHGIARRQEDGAGNPTYLIPNGQYIDLIVSPDPVVFLIAQDDEDYFFTERVSVSQAWGPFTAGITSWLYWDVDFITGEITRGFTNVNPIDSPSEPNSPAVDQHWFDMSHNVMKVWSGSSWIERLRVFACEYLNGAVIIHQPLGSQIGVNGVNIYAGAPIFDEDGKPVQKFRRDRRGKFITTETPLHAQFSRNANFRVEAAIVQAKAIENIPIHYAVAYYGYNEIGLARNTDSDRPAIGISAEPFITNQTRSFITKGYVQDNINWDWSAYSAGTPLFVGVTGELTPDPPQQWTLQQIAIVVDAITVFVDTQHQIIYV